MAAGSRLKQLQRISAMPWSVNVRCRQKRTKAQSREMSRANWRQERGLQATGSTLKTASAVCAQDGVSFCEVAVARRQRSQKVAGMSS